MAYNKLNGETSANDIRLERISAGTLGGEHVVPHSLVGTNVTSVVDDADRRITYGSFDGSATFNTYVGNFAAQNSTITKMNGIDDAIEFRFKGTRLGILGSVTPDGGVLTVYVDGVEMPGRTSATGIVQPSLVGPNQPAVLSTDTEINIANGIGNFAPGGGLARIGSEIISYSNTFEPGIGSTGSFNSRPGFLQGVVRGLYGTVAEDHYRYETVHTWDHTIDVSSIDYSFRKLLWYNDKLEPGEHRVVVRMVSTGSANGGTTFFFDGFVLGSLIGASNVFTLVETLTTTFTTDGNGHKDIGYMTLQRSDVSLISALPSSITHAETSNTTAMGNIGWRFNTGVNAPLIYYHNGPANTVVTVKLNLVYLGETI